MIAIYSIIIMIILMVLLDYLYLNYFMSHHMFGFLVTTIFIIGPVFSLYAFRKYFTKKQENILIETQLEKTKMESLYHELLIKRYEETEDLRHDFMNHLIVLEHLVNTNE